VKHQRYRPSRPAKFVVAGVLYKRVEKAMLTLRKSVIVAMRQGLLAGSQSSSLNGQLCALDAALIEAFPVPEQKTSGAVLPF
jgi:hypothetical protein